MTVRSAIWRDQLTPEERVALGRGDGQLTITRPDILVVGGGIMGVPSPRPATRSGSARCC